MQRLKNCENSWRNIYIFKAMLTSDQALFSFPFEKNIPLAVAVRANV